MPSIRDLSLADRIRHHARRLDGSHKDYDDLLDIIGNARFVLLGEATHGTQEFYHERALITQRLILEKGFTGVAVEADWPDAWRVNRYVRGESDDASAEQALEGFKRFPTWMWRNTEVVDFVEWLRGYNDAHAETVGFYGLDLYSMFGSISEVLRFLDQTDPEAARQARARYSCFDHYGEDTQHYGYATGIGMSDSCERAVLQQLRDLQTRATEYAQTAGHDAFFAAQQNARLVLNAEEYYRTMFRGRVSSWNLRDRHMAETLEALDEHLGAQAGKPPKLVVWEHNSHIGDARATEVGRLGEWNVGQLAREHWGKDDVRLIGFSTYHGYVTAASAWDEPPQRKRVNPGLPHSYEDIFHQVGLDRFSVNLRERNQATEALHEGRLQRAIGVVYLPRTERQSHYFHARLTDQFDAMIHIDETEAVEPLESPADQRGEAPETFPSGL
ncbi:erythromycin esterase family protein [Massilia arenosa]|uniref:Erythromycin esterase family protein n=1 Tax=Zemynaea arenosa TaxID=2561931 RepID=A0A4Y9SC30_9BURK|nr:erythromycin esterase family protein [Massilia arenosa]TFW19874.1 erythromycin esterase family protein [Massilia arenosa]